MSCNQILYDVCGDSFSVNLLVVHMKWAGDFMMILSYMWTKSSTLLSYLRPCIFSLAPPPTSLPSYIPFQNDTKKQQNQITKSFLNETSACRNVTFSLYGCLLPCYSADRLAHRLDSFLLLLRQYIWSDDGNIAPGVNGELDDKCVPPHFLPRMDFLLHAQH